MKYFFKGSNDYELKPKLKILVVYSYHGFFLFIARFAYKNNNLFFCYNSTYSQCSRFLRISHNVTILYHLPIVLSMNRLPLIFFCYTPSYIPYNQYTCDRKL